MAVVVHGAEGLIVLGNGLYLRSRYTFYIVGQDFRGMCECYADDFQAVGIQQSSKQS